VRGQAAKSISNLNNLLIILKGLPLAYSKDMQDDKKLIFNSFDTVHLCLQVITELMSKIKFNTSQMKNAVDESYSASTDLANWLVQNLGYSFRHAYQLTAKIVSYAIKKNKILEVLTLDELQQFDKNISASILKNLSSTNSMRNKTSYGGTSPQSVKKSIQYAIKKYL